MSREDHTTTPGPWQAQYSAIRSAYSVASVSCGRQVAWISGDSEAQRLGEAEANAHLIARTPELVTTLAAIVETQKAIGPDADPRTKAAAWDQCAEIVRAVLEETDSRVETEVNERPANQTATRGPLERLGQFLDWR